MFGKKQVSESEVCRTILEREDVLQSQVFSLMVDHLRDSVDSSKLEGIRPHLGSLFAQHTNSLVDAVSKKFSQ